jgi:hypothetical protein
VGPALQATPVFALEMHFLFILLPLTLALALPSLIHRAQLSGMRQAAEAEPEQRIY